MQAIVLEGFGVRRAKEKRMTAQHFRRPSVRARHYRHLLHVVGHGDVRVRRRRARGRHEPVLRRWRALLRKGPQDQVDDAPRGLRDGHVGNGLSYALGGAARWQGREGKMVLFEGEWALAFAAEFDPQPSISMRRRRAARFLVD